MKFLVRWWDDHGTKILGSVVATIPGLLVIPDLIPQGQHKWWLLAEALLGTLTVNRGFENSRNKDDP